MAVGNVFALALSVNSAIIAHVYYGFNYNYHNLFGYDAKV